MALALVILAQSRWAARRPSPWPAAIPRAWLTYYQPCDAPAEGPDVTNFDAIIDDAINRRMPLGQGGLPLAAMVDALPDTLPMAIEERSAVLRDTFPRHATLERFWDASARIAQISGWLAARLRPPGVDPADADPPRAVAERL